MISVETARKLNPKLKNLSEEEVVKVIEELYQLGDIALNRWAKENIGSKNLDWLLPKSDEGLTLGYGE